MISLEACTFLLLGLFILTGLFCLYGLMTRNIIVQKTGCWLAFSTFALQTLSFFWGYHKFFPSGLSVGAYLQLISWFIIFCGLVAWWLLHQQTLFLFATQFCLLIFLFSIPWLKYSIPLPTFVKTSFYILHIGILLFFFGILTTGFFVSIFFILISNRIKSKKRILGIWQDFPALGMLDKINGYCTIFLLPLFTIGIIIGFTSSARLGGQLLDGDPKKIISLFVWVLLAILFHNRIANGWKGRKPAILMIIIFMMCLFSIFIINPFFSSMHNFIDF